MARALKLSTSITRVSMTSPHSRQWPSSAAAPDSGRERLSLSTELKPLRERMLLSLDSCRELQPPELLLCAPAHIASAKPQHIMSLAVRHACCTVAKASVGGPPHSLLLLLLVLHLLLLLLMRLWSDLARANKQVGLLTRIEGGDHCCAERLSPGRSAGGRTPRSGYAGWPGRPSLLLARSACFGCASSAVAVPDPLRLSPLP